MAALVTNAGVEARVEALLAHIPAGYVTTHRDVAKHLSLLEPAVVTAIAALAARTPGASGWWRVVANGGAVGRHMRRDEHIERLRADGIVLSPVGIVQDLAARRVPDLDNPPQAPMPGPQPLAPSRSRGMLGKPRSSL
jgi:alkylated DNA nucleotide flippase Atl1